MWSGAGKEDGFFAFGEVNAGGSAELGLHFGVAEEHFAHHDSEGAAGECGDGRRGEQEGEEALQQSAGAAEAGWLLILAVQVVHEWSSDAAFISKHVSGMCDQRILGIHCRRVRRNQARVILSRSEAGSVVASQRLRRIERRSHGEAERRIAARAGPAGLAARASFRRPRTRRAKLVVSPHWGQMIPVIFRNEQGGSPSC